MDKELVDEPKKSAANKSAEPRLFDRDKDLEGLVVLDKHEVVKWINNLSHTMEKERALNPDVLRERKSDKDVLREPKTDKEILEVKIIDAIGGREERKQLLGRLGINAETPDDYRLAFYDDKYQHVVFKGKMDEKTGKLTLTDRLVLDANLVSMEKSHHSVFADEEKKLDAEKKKFDITDEKRTDALRKYQEKAAGEAIVKFLSTPLTPLPEGKTIEIPAENATKIKFRNSNDTSEGMTPETMQKIELPPEELKKLETKVTLIALADKAMDGSVKVAGSNLGLPNRGPTSEVGLA